MTSPRVLASRAWPACVAVSWKGRPAAHRPEGHRRLAAQCCSRVIPATRRCAAGRAKRHSPKCSVGGSAADAVWDAVIGPGDRGGGDRESADRAQARGVEYDRALAGPVLCWAAVMAEAAQLPRSEE